MMVLVTRPQPAASRTADRLQKLGHSVIIAPLLVARALDWALPLGDWQAVVFTSAGAPALGGPGLAALNHLPAYAVGRVTASAAQLAGFTDVRAARGDATAVFALAAADGVTRLLHLAGADRSAATIPQGLTVEVVEVYAADPVAPRHMPRIDLVLLYSARTAGLFAASCPRDRSRVRIAALSANIAAAAGPGWGRVIVAAEPTEDALFAAAGLTCDSPGPNDAGA